MASNLESLSNFDKLKQVMQALYQIKTRKLEVDLEID